MVSFLKKLFGGGEAKGTEPLDRGTTVSESASPSPSGTVDRAAAGATEAAAAATQAEASAHEAGDRASSTAAGAAATLDGAAEQAGGMAGGGLPDMRELQGAIDQLSPAELSGALTGALHGVPAETRDQLGSVLTGAMSGEGTAEIAGGDPNALGNALSGLLKTEGGLEQLAALLGGDAGASAAGGGLDLQSLMSNPMARSVLTAIVPAIMRAAQTR